ncbi:J domain-containing protein [Frigidibacter sp. ROC022]|uniref:J domain-containing protein n=1 Tax=Frigidibacter sp. ROC022 TaxID=2971796 RepID=UPI00215A1077|nr:J domain-containing protein [Frigidibacter sp. ROC022]MCR8725371.1 J domain-containing protein [Frigidibacter sp. ROC022]
MDFDPYATLGLKPSATQDEIKSAYRKLVRTSHPDINPDDPEAEARFVKVSAAYDLLKDPETRARYDAGEIDAEGHEKPQRNYYRDFAGSPGAGAGAHGGPRDFSGMDPDDIFAEFFRQRAGQRHSNAGSGFGAGFSAPGPDHRYALEVPFLDAVRGGTSRITLPDGNTLDVTIPEGLRDGQTLRLRGKGGEGFGGGPRGDALVTVSVRPHKVFRREGDDIAITLPITIDEAILGAKVEVPTIKGTVALTIPKGASSGRVLRLRGRGVKRKGGHGDQLVTLSIVVPKAPDPKLAAFLEEWRKGRNDDPRKELLKGAMR